VLYKLNHQIGWLCCVSVVKLHSSFGVSWAKDWSRFEAKGNRFVPSSTCHFVVVTYRNPSAVHSMWRNSRSALQKDELWLPCATIYGVVILFSCYQQQLTTGKWQCSLATFRNGATRVNLLLGNKDLGTLCDVSCLVSQTLEKHTKTNINSQLHSVIGNKDRG
jgi:hypothetical protein